MKSFSLGMCLVLFCSNFLKPVLERSDPNRKTAHHLLLQHHFVMLLRVLRPGLYPSVCFPVSFGALFCLVFLFNRNVLNSCLETSVVSAEERNVSLSCFITQPVLKMLECT